MARTAVKPDLLIPERPLSVYVSKTILVNEVQKENTRLICLPCSRIMTRPRKIVVYRLPV